VWRELADVDTWKPLLWVHDELMVEIEDSLPYWGELLISLVTETELAQAQPIPVVAGWHEVATWADLK